MNNWKKYTLAAVILTVPGFACAANPQRNISADLKDTVAVNGEFNTAIPVINEDLAGLPLPKAAAVDGVVRGVSTKPVEWVAIKGGKFTMGTNGDEIGLEDAKPAHVVAIKTFEMSKTAVTVEQYSECVARGRCTEPKTGSYCNWGKAGRETHPVNCVSWHQADQYAKFKGARLPSESEWEYAATGGGRDQKYPWGNDEPTCDKAVMFGNGDSGCGTDATMPVCSKPAGNTAQGLCDMAGNVYQWVQDESGQSYDGAPADGSAFEGKVPGRVRGMRGSPFDLGASSVAMSVIDRSSYCSDNSASEIGFRLAKSK
ncbi:MAG: formylglycine-generating enzyme family protein [Elusimicrobia bacterium]|nr:formylglycine-generating enzyme family protein [Elusimicrobiota bacterium]